MFYYLKGTIEVIEPNLVVVDCHGVGYRCHTTNNTISALQLGQPAKLLTHCNIREDAFDIFGFSSKEELTCFQRLISVTGVGPKAALAILSTATPSQFTLAVVTGDEKMLTRAPGIGKKIAQRIILELKDKLAGETTDLDFSAPTAMAVGGSNLAEATAALAALGYSPSEVGLALKGADPASSVEDLVRFALRAMVMK